MNFTRSSVCCNITGKSSSKHCSGNTFPVSPNIYKWPVVRLHRPWYAAFDVTRRNTSSFQNTSLWCIYFLCFVLFFRHQLTSGDWGRNTFSVTSQDSFQTSWIPLQAGCLSTIYNRKYDIYLPRCPVAQRVDNAIDRTNHYSADKCWQNILRHTHTCRMIVIF